MAPQEDLDQFLSDLSGRRVRLLELVGSDPTTQSAMMDELSELGEQLLVADEELRVQQEQLDDSRRQVELLNQENGQLFASAQEAWVLTDENGLVIRTTRAAEQLVLQPSARLTPRPVATWFDVGDRGLIRRMIGRRGDHETQVLEHAVLRRSDGTGVPVRVSLSRAAAVEGQGPVLRWELSRQDRPSPALRVVGPVAEPSPAVEPVSRGADHTHLALGLVDVVGRLAERQPLTMAYSTVVSAGLTLVPMADHVGLVLYQRRGRGQPATASDLAASTADLSQLELGGPLTVALAENRPVRLDDTGVAGEWPAFATRVVPLGIRSVLSVPLTLTSYLPRPGSITAPAPVPVQPGLPNLPEHRVGALSFYAQDPEAFDAGAETAASLLAAHAAAALTWLSRDANLQDALASRQLIGEAVGVLVERKKLTSAAAFDVLIRRSQNANLKLRELARIVVETGQDPADIVAP